MVSAASRGPRPSSPAGPLKLLVAAGPYTSDEDLQFEPLQDLLHLAEDEKPDAVLLLGPFLHEEHPMVRQGFLGGMTYEELLATKFRQRLLDFVRKEEEVDESPRRTAFFLIPSTRCAWLEWDLLDARRCLCRPHGCPPVGTWWLIR